MEEIKLDSFKGIAPRYGKNLPVGFAESAINCMLYHGKLSPLAKNTQVEAETNHYNSFAYHCLSWEYGNNRFFCPWKMGVLDLLLYKDDSNYLKKKVSCIITKTDISFDAASKEIRSANGDFNVDSLIEGTTFVVSGSANNDGTFTVSSTATTTTVITVDEAVVNESAGNSVTIKICKEDYLGQTRQAAPTTSVGSYSGEEEPGEWSLMADQFGAETNITALCVFDNKIYAGTYPGGRLFEWDETNNCWIPRADQLGAEDQIECLCVYNDELYGGTSPNAKLYKWNGTDAWTEVAGQAGAETDLDFLIVFNDKLYGSTNPLAKLFEWNDVDAWVEVAGQPGTETQIEHMVIYNDELYAGSTGSGKLFKWNEVDAWVEKAGQLGTETIIDSLVVYNDELYGSTYPSAKLYKWNDVDAWTEVAGQLGSETFVDFLIVYNNELYGTTAPSGKLYKWNDSDAWIEKADQFESETYVNRLVEFDGGLYGGTGIVGGYLVKYIPSQTTYDIQYFITLTRNIGGHLDESGPGTVTDVDNVIGGVEYQNITVTKPAWTGLGSDTYVTHWNIYRLSNATATWQLVAQVAWATASYVDAVADADLGSTCPAYYTSDQGNEIIWDLPLKNLDGITTKPIYGIIFGWKGGTLYWTEPGYPDAWVGFYNMNFPGDIKNCIPREPALAVLTSVGPLRVDGSNPETLQQSGICGPNPAMSVLGCCETQIMGGGVLFLSDSGIAFFDMTSSKIITDDGFGEEWFKANISPTGAVMIEVDNIVYLFHNAGGLVADFRSDPPKAITLSEIIYGAYRKKDDDELYVMDGSGIQKFGAASSGTKAMTWLSGELLGDHPKDNKTFVETEVMSDSAVAITVTNYINGTSSQSATLSMDTVRDKILGFLDTKCVGRAAQFKIYKATHDTLTPSGLEITEAIVRYTR